MKTIFAQELMAEMNDKLESSNRKEDTSNAIDSLNAASILFEEAGLNSVANDIMKLIVKIAKKEPKKESKKEKGDWHTKKLTPEKMVENLKHHGTVFNMNDDDMANATDEQKEYHSWLKDLRKPATFTKDDVDPDLADLMDLDSFDLNASDDDLLNLEIEEDEIQKDIEKPHSEMDFEDELEKD